MAEDTLTPSATEGDSAGAGPVPSGVAAPPSPQGRPPGAVRRALEWFWRGRALKRLRADAKQASPAARELADRARLLFALGERARLPAEPLPSSADATAAELYRQSAFFAARALADRRGASPATPWEGLASKPLADACGGAERAAELVRLVETGSFTDTWGVAKEERALRATDLAGLCRFLLGELAWETRARDALWLQRFLRLGGVLALILGVLLGFRAMRDSTERRYDVAVGKAWRTSSSAGMGCTSPQQQCGNGSDFFFHTNEERNPWVEIDLGRPMEVSAVRLVNRRDCCFERAIPIVVELATNPEHFKEVGRRTAPFSSWRADFPKTSARYVRARVLSKSVMHLAEVRVLTQ